MDIIIATENDLESFYSTFSQVLEADFPEYSKATIEFFLKRDYSLSNLKNGIENKRFKLFLAKKDQDTVGFLLSSKVYGGIGFCNWIGVIPSHRGKGIGSSLMEEWEKSAKEDGAHKAHLQTSGKNKDFYLNRGYILLGVIPENYFGATDYIFYKVLQTPNETNFLK